MQLAFCHASVDDFGSIEVMFSGVANSDNSGGGGFHIIHIFLFTDFKNNRFQIKEINNAEHKYMNMDPQIFELATPLVMLTHN